MTAGAEAANASKVGAWKICTEGAGAEGRDAPGTSTARGAPGSQAFEACSSDRALYCGSKAAEDVAGATDTNEKKEEKTGSLGITYLL